jgi:hypothetical protein
MARKPETPLPRRRAELGFPDGDGPQWVSRCLRAALADVDSYLSDEGGYHVLKFENGRELVVRVEHVATRRIEHLMQGLGFKIPHYSDAQLGELGSAIARIGRRNLERATEDHRADLCSALEAWLADSLEQLPPFELTERTGVTIRAAIEHVRRNTLQRAPTPLIFEPDRNVLLVWTVPVRTMLRDRFGTLADATISLHLARSEIRREHLAARPGPGQISNQKLPVFVLGNGWQGIEVDIGSYAGDSPNGAKSVSQRSYIYTREEKPRARVEDRKRWETGKRSRRMASEASFRQFVGPKP